MLFSISQVKFFKKSIVAVIFMLSASATAQTISSVSVSPQNPCAGSQVTVTFTAKSGLLGTFSSNTVFTVTLYQNLFFQVGTLASSTVNYNFGGILSNNTGITMTVNLPSNVSGNNFFVHVSSSNPGSILGASSGTFSIGVAAQGGSLQNQIICSGSIPNSLTLSGHVGQIVKWQKSTNASFTSAVDIAVTSATLSGATLGAITQPTYVRALVQNGGCTAYSSTALIGINDMTNWIGTNGSDWHDVSNWSCGIPGANTNAIIPSNSTISINADAIAGSIQMAEGASLTVISGNDITVTNAVSVAEGGQFILQNNANLLQISNVANSGKIVVNRKSSALKRSDYTLWSSPVQGQNLFAFSPLTVTNRFYIYNTNTNLYNSIPTPSAEDFITGKGYLIRMPNNHPTTATMWNGKFTGTPNNGSITVPLTNAGVGKRYNLIGNPYPSPINLQTFISQNSANITGSVYFWRKTNNAASPSYCSWTAIGGFVSNGEAQVFNPNDVLQTGQGFIVEAKGNATSVVFNNNQRIGNNVGQFFRTAQIERHRIWLNLTGETGAFSQTLVGYFEGATLEEDQNIDAKYMNDGEVTLASTIDGTDYAIQGRPLPFDATDVVPMKVKFASAGNYTIAIDHVDGLFEEGTDIILNDKLANVSHNLLDGAYQFNSDAGTFTDRFEITYGTQLSTGDHQIDRNNILVSSENGIVAVRSSVEMKAVSVYDIHGRLIQQANTINGNEVRLNVGSNHQVLIVKIDTPDGKSVTKKVVN